MFRKDNALFSILRMICRRIFPVFFLIPLNAFGAPLDDADPCHLSIRRVSSSAETIFLLDTVSLTYEISHDASCRLEIKPFAHQSIACVSQGETLVSTDETTQTQTASVTCRYRNPGIFYTIPVVFNAINRNNTNLSKVYAEPYRVEVQAYLPGFDAASPLLSELQWMPWETGWGKMAAVLLSLSALGVIIGVVVHRRRKREATVQEPEPVALSPMERFRREVDRVSGWNLETLENTKTYYTILSLALRKLTGDLFAFDAMPMTTAQLCARLESDAIPKEAIGCLRALLNQSDYIKYFKALPSDSSNRAFLNDTLSCAETFHRLWEDRLAESARREENASDAPNGEASVESQAEERMTEEK